MAKHKTSPRQKKSAQTQVITVIPADAEQPVQAAISAWSPWHHGWLLFAGFLVLVLLLYGKTLNYPMVFDDVMYLQSNPLFTDPASYRFPFWYREFVNKPAAMGIDPDLAVNFVLRPVAYLSFYANYLIDGFNPRGYRLVNFGIHAANALLIYHLLLALFRQSSPRLVSPPAWSRHVPLFTALLFAVHPLATESVTYIVQRFTSLAALFFLLALLLQVHAWQETHPKRQRGWKIGALVSVVLGMLTKECTVMAPIILVMMDMLVLGTAWRQALRRNAWFLLTLPLVPAMVLLVSAVQQGGALDLGQAIHITNNRDAPMAYSAYLLTQLTVMLHYVKLLVWPTGQNVDPEWPAYQSLTQGPVLVALVMLLSGLALALGCWWRRQSFLSSFTLLSVLWFLLLLFPSSGLVPLPDFVAEHRTYLPSMGLFLIIACGMQTLLSRFPSTTIRPKAAAFVSATILLALSAGTWQRNEVWHSKVSLWEDACSKSPNKYRVWNNLGAAYFEVGDIGQAIEKFRQALVLEPRYETPYYNLMLMHGTLKQPQQSLAVYEQLCRVSPAAAHRVPVAFQHGVALVATGRVQEGLGRFHEVVEAEPKHHAAQVALGALYFDKKLFGKALHHWHLASSIQPPNPTLERLIQSAQDAVRTQAVTP